MLWLQNLRNPTGRLARWAFGLLKYDYKMAYRKSSLHHVPDALSRAPVGESENCETIEVARMSPDKCYSRKYRNVQRAPDFFPDWKIYEGRLYTHRPSDFVTLEMVDLDAWKLVLPQELR